MSDIPLEDHEKQRLISMLRDFTRIRGGRASAAPIWGVSERTLAGYLSGESDPKLSFLSAVAASEGISVADFFIEREENCTSVNPEVVRIPMRDVTASAGPGAENGDEPISGHMHFPSEIVRSWGRNPAKIEAVQVFGDSMLPTIADRQWVLIDRSERELSEGNVFAFRTQDGLRLKRFQRSISGAPMLVSDNRELYAPEVLQPLDLEQLRVAGRAFLPLKTI